MHYPKFPSNSKDFLLYRELSKLLRIIFYSLYLEFRRGKPKVKKLTSHSLSIWFNNFLQADCPSSESRSMYSSLIQSNLDDKIVVFSSSKKLALHLNSSKGVSGRAGAVEALKGSNREQSKNSSVSTDFPFIWASYSSSVISPKVSYLKS